MNYSDKALLDDKEELGKATFYFNKKDIYSDEASKNYHWMGKSYLERENMDAAKEKLSMFADELKLLQSNEVTDDEAEYTELEENGYFILSIKRKDMEDNLEEQETLYINK